MDKQLHTFGLDPQGNDFISSLMDKARSLKIAPGHYSAYDALNFFINVQPRFLELAKEHTHYVVEISVALACLVYYNKHHGPFPDEQRFWDHSIDKGAVLKRFCSLVDKQMRGLATTHPDFHKAATVLKSLILNMLEETRTVENFVKNGVLPPARGAAKSTC